MNFVILNGVKSTTIQGLLIQALPPISKPMIRTSIEEIDGRDGDIVTKLGYSAYDKEMSIGLFGNYDVDEVINYFNSEGVVIFSNEPDKFYNYQIINQIDFEKLIRFKTATVTFHVQPFKYSAIDDSLLFTKERLGIKPYTATMSGVNLKVENGQITINGSASRTVELYVPIVPMRIGDGSYTVKTYADGTGSDACQMRIIDTSPTDADSFGGTYIQPEDNTEVDMSVVVSGTEKTFNYLWLEIASGTQMDFTLDVNVIEDSIDSIMVFNRGNTISRPTLTLYGNGDVDLYINGVKLFDLTLSDYMTIDAEAMNAYKGDTLVNRSVVGDYGKLILNIGSNTISWVGNITKIAVEKGSRWI